MLQSPALHHRRRFAGLVAVIIIGVFDARALEAWSLVIFGAVALIGSSPTSRRTS
jgi:hypothetical protein